MVCVCMCVSNMCNDWVVMTDSLANVSFNVLQSQITAMVSRTRMDYERVHDRIMLEVPQLLEVRASYLEVCLMAAIRAQVSSCSHKKDGWEI